MKVTPATVQAARRAEFDYYQKGRRIGAERFIATPDEVIRVMLAAELAAAGDAARSAPKEPALKAPRSIPHNSFM